MTDEEHEKWDRYYLDPKPGELWPGETWVIATDLESPLNPPEGKQ